MIEYNKYTNCEASEEWLKKSGGYPSMDYDITEPIDFSLGVGCVNDEGLVTSRDDKYYNTVTLTISSWIGHGRARHIYGKLRIPSVICKLPSGGTSSSCGYGTPNYISGWEISLTKELNQHALDLDEKGHPADKCFEDMELGEETTRFEEDEEAMLIDKANEIFKKWFTGNWQFEIERD